MALSPISVFFLTLERCLVLQYTVQYDAHIRRFIEPITALTFFAVTAMCLTFMLLELPLSEDG